MLRQATLADLNAVVALEHSGFSEQQAYNRRQFFRLLSPTSSDVLLVDEERGVLRGQVALRWHQGWRVGNIYDVVVHSGHREKGIATALLAEAEKRARGQELMALHVEVRADNLPTRALYEAQEFVFFKDLHDYYGEGEPGVRMRKVLSHQKASVAKGDRVAE